jgi:hypothetical protein
MIYQFMIFVASMLFFCCQKTSSNIFLPLVLIGFMDFGDNLLSFFGHNCLKKLFLNNKITVLSEIFKFYNFFTSFFLNLKIKSVQTKSFIRLHLLKAWTGMKRKIIFDE